MMTLVPQVLRNERNVCCLFFFLLFSYYISMDIITYITIQSTTFTDQSRGESYSMFRPLSAKLVMSDHTNHYFMVPTTEMFDELTRFSKVFYFVTPNMVTITHFILALVAAKFVSSENLRTRRIAVVIYEFRIWLDSLDGVIYRSHANDPVYKSNKSTLGYYMDTTLDVLGGIAFNLGVLFFLFKCAPMICKTQDHILPFCKPPVVENGTTNGNGDKTYVKPSKRFIFWKAWCFGFQIFMASGSWDKRTEQMGEVLETKLKAPEKVRFGLLLVFQLFVMMSVLRYEPHMYSGFEMKNNTSTIKVLYLFIHLLQTEMLHSFSTWVVMYLWRLCDGQSLFQVFLVVIFIDKIWEFFNFVQYVGYCVLLAVNIITVVHINHVKSVIGMK